MSTLSVSPHGVHLDDLRAVEAQDDVEVVDHQVEHHVDVEAARRERAESMDFDEAGLPYFAPQDVHRGVEPLDVADLEDDSAALGQLDEVIRLPEGRGHRFLQEHVSPSLQEPPSYRVMVYRRHCDRNGIRLGGDRVESRQGLSAVARRHLRRTLAVRVVHADELDSVEIREDASMMLA